jgi:prepilin-type N-terminal cleavage/methylation domain-containing protein
MQLNSSRGRRQANRGFSLTELAVVFAIVALLIGGAMATLSSQIEQRNNDEAVRRLNAAVDALIAFAIVNGRLPCPARYTSAASNSAGQESFCAAATGTCAGGETIAVQTHGNCSNFYDGYVPATSIGMTPVDSAGFLIDAWGNRVRYAVARDFFNPSCTTTPPANTRIWTSQANLKTYGVSCRSNDLDICVTSVGTNATSCNTATRVVSSTTAGFVVISTGKNGASPATFGADELENTDADPVFVSRTPTPSDAIAGYYDDIVVFVPVGVLYSKLIAAGQLP